MDTNDYLVLVELEKGYTIPVIIKNVENEILAIIKVLDRFKNDDNENNLEIVGTKVIKMLTDIIIMDEK